VGGGILFLMGRVGMSWALGIVVYESGAGYLARVWWRSCKMSMPVDVSRRGKVKSGIVALLWIGCRWVSVIYPSEIRGMLCATRLYQPRGHYLLRSV
jgi:hypothetical protein